MSTYYEITGRTFLDRVELIWNWIDRKWIQREGSDGTTTTFDVREMAERELLNAAEDADMIDVRVVAVNIEDEEEVSDYDRAVYRVRHDEQLAKFESYILADWPEGEEHFRWVATATKRELLSWIRAGIDNPADVEPLRDRVIRLRVTDTEKQAITTAAQSAGQTISDYIRGKVL